MNSYTTTYLYALVTKLNDSHTVTKSKEKYSIYIKVNSLSLRAYIGSKSVEPVVYIVICHSLHRGLDRGFL